MSKRFSQDTTTLTTFDDNFDTSNLVFSDAIMNEVKSGNQVIKNYRVYLGIKNPDGTTGNLMVATEKLFSFGISESSNEQKELTGYTMPVALWNKSEPADIIARKKMWLAKFQEVGDSVANHLVKKDVRKKIGRSDLVKGDLRKLANVYWKKDENDEPLMDEGPTMYLKVKYFAANAKMKRSAKVVTIFVNEKTEQTMTIDELMAKRMNVTCVLDIESVYIGAKITLQIKVHEAVIEPVDQQQRRFLTRKATMLSAVTTSNAVNPMLNKSPAQADSKEDDDDDDVAVDDVAVDDVVKTPPKASPVAVPIKAKRKKVSMTKDD